MTGMHESLESTGGEARFRPSNHAWRKSSRSVSDGHCVEVALSNELLLMRDSKDITGPKLAFSAHVWNSFVQEIKSR